jgi:outer membrane protein assembly factor BamD
MADYYLKHRRNYKAAKVFYNEAITVFPDSPVAQQAREKLLAVEAKLEEQTQVAPAAGQQPASKPAQPKKAKRFWIF